MLREVTVWTLGYFSLTSVMLTCRTVGKIANIILDNKLGFMVSLGDT